MLRPIFAPLALICSLSVFADDQSYKYQCDLNGTKSDIGAIVTVFLEDGTSTIIQCRVPLSLDFKGDATYKIKASEAQWILFGPHSPVDQISGPHTK